MAGPIKVSSLESRINQRAPRGQAGAFERVDTAAKRDRGAERALRQSSRNVLTDRRRQAAEKATARDVALAPAGLSRDRMLRQESDTKLQDIYANPLGQEELPFGRTDELTEKLKAAKAQRKR